MKNKYTVYRTSAFNRSLKRVKKRGYDISLLEKVINILLSGQDLPARYRDHKLVGKYSSFRECHITPDWLLIYEIQEEKLILYLVRTGTHSDLFKK